MAPGLFSAEVALFLVVLFHQGVHEQASRGGQLHLKKQVSMRIDDDILDFFKSERNRYQTRMHAVLRAYVDVHRAK